MDRKDEADNIPIWEVGSPIEMWNKIMKEVKEHRYTGPFTSPPFDHYVQSPVGVVPKAEGKTRLISHLSYAFGKDEHQQSINHHILDRLCSVKYNDLDCAVRNSLKILDLFWGKNALGTETLYYAKSDCSSTFRVLPVQIGQRCPLVIKMKHPITHKMCYFVDKCLPFGASISCAICQEFSNVLKPMSEWRIKVIMKVTPALTNYLDDFLFVAISIIICNGMMRQFLWVCKFIGCPVSMEKTEWAMPILIFLGILMNGKMRTLSVPNDKKDKAIQLLTEAVNKKKATIKKIQKLTGTLNFLNRAIVLGRAFTRGMYSHLKLRNDKGKILKQHYHVNLSRDFVMDCKMWLQFLREVGPNNQRLCRPFIDLYSMTHGAHTLCFYLDTSRSKSLGMGAIF